MVDTLRTETDLASNLFQDGQAPGSITASDVRDLILSAFGVYATVQTASYTAVLADAGTCVEMNVAGANDFTVPPNSSVAFAIGTTISILQYGAGQVTLVAGAGVTLRNSASLTTRAQYSTIAIRKRATNEWIVTGDVT